MATGAKFNAIYLGNRADLEAPSGTSGAYSDVDDSTYLVSEANSNSLLGTYDSSVMQVVEITAYHRANDTLIGLDSYPTPYGDGQEGVEYSVAGGNTVGDGIVTTTTTPFGTPPPDYNNGTTGGIAIDNDVYYNATVTYLDPVTGNEVTANKIVAVFQTDNGDVFLQEYLNSNSSLFNLDNLDIKEIELTSVYTSDADGVVYDNWSIDGTSIVCFARGTLIETDNGLVAVENLYQGSFVLTKDSGFQPIRWIGSKTVTTQELVEYPDLRPIRIRQGALGNGCPTNDLVVSPQHRVLISSKIVARMFIDKEVLVAAKHLCEIDGIAVETDLTEVEYFHFMFDEHEIVYSDGAETESMFTGKEALKSIGAAARSEIFNLFPELLSIDYEPLGVRQFAASKKSRRLAMRHAKNDMALVLGAPHPTKELC